MSQWREKRDNTLEISLRRRENFLRYVFDKVERHMEPGSGKKIVLEITDTENDTIVDAARIERNGQIINEDFLETSTDTVEDDNNKFDYGI